MKIRIICSAERALRPPSRCSSLELSRLRDAALAGAVIPEGARVLNAEGMTLFVSPRAAAAETAAALVKGAEARVEPLLDETPLPEILPGRVIPSILLRLLISLRRLLGVGAAPERRRADELADRLESEGKDCVLVTHPGFAAVLIDRLRPRGYCARRTGMGRIKPLEFILLSRRDEHCGGCLHNCLLSNPGCGVGRDKAARRKR